VVVDGVRQTSVSRVFASKTDPDIIIVKVANDKLVSAAKKDKTTGMSTDVNRVNARRIRYSARENE
jgi:hypothetical protein